MKLIFGDKKSIKYRDNYISKAKKDIILNKLKNIKCPLCGAKNVGHFEIDLKKKYIGWNFNCLDSCPNSIEYIEKNGGDDGVYYSDLNGQFTRY